MIWQKGGGLSYGTGVGGRSPRRVSGNRSPRAGRPHAGNPLSSWGRASGLNTLSWKFTSLSQGVKVGLPGRSARRRRKSEGRGPGTGIRHLSRGRRRLIPAPVCPSCVGACGPGSPPRSSPNSSTALGCAMDQNKQNKGRSSAGAGAHSPRTHRRHHSDREEEKQGVKKSSQPITSQTAFATHQQKH